VACIPHAETLIDNPWMLWWSSH